MFMRRSRTVEVQPGEPFTCRSGVLAVVGLACAIAASCAPASGDKGAPPGTGGSGGAGGRGGGTGGTAGTGGAGGSGMRDGPAATDSTIAVADTKPEATGGADVAPTSDVSSSGSDDTNAGDVASAGPKIPAGTVAKIMVLGSSNETRTCWRAFLWQKLRAAGVMNFDLVGRTNVGPDCGVAGYDKDVEAAPGTIITGFSANDFAIRYKANPPDIVLVHVAGADARDGVPIARILAAYTLMVQQARAVKPNVVFFVGQHTPQQPMTGILELNAAIPGWAMQTSTPDSPVFSVDLYTGIVPAMDLSDGTHLNENGSKKVADRFFAPVLPMFKP
jgi:mannan endo-1,4-beta-mannosidase